MINLWVPLALLVSSIAMAAEYPVVAQARPSVYGSPEGVQCPVRLVPGKSIGKISLGMTLDQVADLGMKIKRVQDTSSYVVGPYSVSVDRDTGKVEFIEAELGDLPHCVVVGNQR